jgi:hypothetical protein
MTIKEALQRRIPRVRQPQWSNPQAYLRLPLFADGSHGPWAELYDDVTQQDALDVRPGSQRILVLESCGQWDGQWDVYAGPVSVFEQDPKNFAGVYVES